MQCDNASTPLQSKFLLTDAYSKASQTHEWLFL